MIDLPPTRTLAENRSRFARLANAEKGPRANLRTRVALVAHDRRLTKKQLAKFQKGHRFDFVAFAGAHDISLDWLIDGDLRMHPRVPAPPREKKQPRQKTAPTAEEFLRLVAQLPPEDRPALLAKMRQLANRVTS
jgi:hypothetical protein